jgi:hypothetical protein
MDKATIALIEDVRKSLVDYGKTQSGSALKKTRKITSQIIWDPSSYLDELDNIKATSKTPQEAIQRIRTLVRSSEEAALKSMTLLPDDTGHHIVQSRTGGDALTELPYERTGPIIERLSAKHKQTFGNTVGPGGNLPAEMSLSNYAHKADDRATGIERESGIGKNPDKTTTAHQKGTAGYANMKGVDLADDAAIEADLSRKIGEQQQMARTAAATDAPRQAAIRKIAPGAYQGGVKDIAKARKAVTPQLLTNRNAILDAYRTLARNKTFGALLPGVGIGIGALDVAERSAKAAETKDPTDTLQAGLASAGMTPAVGGVADLANIVIDAYRWKGSHQRIRGRSGAQKALQAR